MWNCCFPHFNKCVVVGLPSGVGVMPPYKLGTGDEGIEGLPGFVRVGKETRKVDATGLIRIAPFLLAGKNSPKISGLLAATGNAVPLRI